MLFVIQFEITLAFWKFKFRKIAVVLIDRHNGVGTHFMSFNSIAIIVVIIKVKKKKDYLGQEWNFPDFLE